jgi:RNA polymerase sigma-70 factor, ECF subfamily
MVTSATTLVFAAFAAFSEDEAPEPGFAGLTPQHAIGQSLAGGQATSMGQRERGQLERASEMPVAAPASDAGAELRPVDAIMDRYAQGDDAALDDLYRLCASRVRGFLARLCANLPLADDLTQDAFLRIHAARGTFVAGAPALPWIFAIARNAYLDHLRREQVRRAHRTTTTLLANEQVFQLPANGGDRAAIARQMLGVVQQTLMRLPVRQREAFVLIRFEGLSLAEAALVLGATQAAVKILVHRAYVVVRAELEKQDPDGRAGG